MGILTDDMKRIVREQRLGYIATVCADGTSNLSPKGTTTVWDDDHLMFADIRSPQSVQNIERNPSVEVNVIDPLVRKGYRFKGRGIVHRSDDVFERGCQMYRDAGATSEITNKIRAVILIRVERALPLISPAYDRGATQDQVKIDGAVTGASCGTESKNDATGTVALLGFGAKLSQAHLGPDVSGLLVNSNGRERR
jgi:uncharacterized protein